MSRWLALALLVLMILPPVWAKALPAFESEYVRGVVRQVEGTGTGELVTVKITSGEDEGRIITVENIRSGPAYFDVEVSPGARVILQRELMRDTGKVDYYLADRERASANLLLGSLYILLLLIIAGVSGGKLLGLFVVLGLGLNLLVQNPQWGSWPVILGLMGLSVLALFLGVRFQRVRYLQGVRVLGAALCGWLVSLLMVRITPLSGQVNEGVMYLQAVYPSLDVTFLMLGAWFMVLSGAAWLMLEALERLPSGSEGISQRMAAGRPVLLGQSAALALVLAGMALPFVMPWVDTSVYKLLNLESVSAHMTLGLVMLLTQLFALLVWARFPLRRKSD